MGNYVAKNFVKLDNQSALFFTIVYPLHERNNSSMFFTL